MNYGVAGANVGPGYCAPYPVAGVSQCVGGSSNLGFILVLFILLVIILRSCCH